MIETYLLEQFVAFARCGTLLGAAEELHITQPTLSRSMKKLEDELGVSIFHRENSKLSLNETGKIAAEYAERALDANRELIDHVLAYDRSLRTVSLGSCSPFPINELMPALQEGLPGKTILTELVENDDRLLTGLKNRQYDLAILHSPPEDKGFFCQRYMDEQLYLSIAEDHPLAAQESISFDDLKGLRILMSEGIGFWMEITLRHLSRSDLLIQSSFEALAELIDASALPVFNSDKMLETGIETPGRVSVPIRDEDARATYWLVCRATEQSRFRSIFSAVRAYALQHDNK